MLKVSLLLASLVLAHSALLGGWRSMDPTALDDDIREFVEKSLNDRSNGIFLTMVTSVKSVQTQLVNGVNYRINFELGKTSCAKNAGMNVRLRDCPTTQGLEQQCTARVYVPFKGNKELSSFDCNKKTMAKRAGGIKSVAKPEIFRDTAIRALAMSNAALTNVRIISAQTQVVSGQRIILKVAGDIDNGKSTTCDIDVWSRPWLGGDAGFRVSKITCEDNSAFKTQNKRAILGGVTGSISDDLDNREDFLPTAKKALSMTNSLLDNLVIVKARTQTVSGRNIFLTVSGTQFGVKKMCDITVWIRTWLPGDEGFKVTQLQCSPQPNVRALVLPEAGRCAGCVSDEVKNPEVNSYYSLYIRAFGLAQTNMDVNNVRIVSVRTRVVAGIKYYMKVQTSEAGEPRMCDVQFVMTPWMTPSMKVIKFDCKPI